jgi:hypothetical protein
MQSIAPGDTATMSTHPCPAYFEEYMPASQCQKMANMVQKSLGFYFFNLETFYVK